jgi:hypothetical protein
MSRPGFKPGPPAREASTLEKSHLDSLSAGYSEPLLSRHLLTTFGPLQYLHRSLFCGINLFLKLHLYITFVLILDKKNLQTKVAAMPSSFMIFCRVPDLKKCVKLKFASEINIIKMNHKKLTFVK